MKLLDLCIYKKTIFLFCVLLININYSIKNILNKITKIKTNDIIISKENKDLTLNIKFYYNKKKCKILYDLYNINYYFVKIRESKYLNQFNLEIFDTDFIVYSYLCNLNKNIKYIYTNSFNKIYNDSNIKLYDYKQYMNNSSNILSNNSNNLDNEIISIANLPISNDELKNNTYNLNNCFDNFQIYKIINQTSLILNLLENKTSTIVSNIDSIMQTINSLDKFIIKISEVIQLKIKEKNNSLMNYLKQFNNNITNTLSAFNNNSNSKLNSIEYQMTKMLDLNSNINFNISNSYKNKDIKNNKINNTFSKNCDLRVNYIKDINFLKFKYDNPSNNILRFIFNNKKLYYFLFDNINSISIYNENMTLIDILTTKNKVNIIDTINIKDYNNEINSNLVVVDKNGFICFYDISNIYNIYIEYEGKIHSNKIDLMFVLNKNTMIFTVNNKHNKYFNILVYNYINKLITDNIALYYEEFFHNSSENNFNLNIINVFLINNINLDIVVVLFNNFYVKLYYLNKLQQLKDNNLVVKIRNTDSTIFNQIYINNVVFDKIKSYLIISHDINIYVFKILIYNNDFNLDYIEILKGHRNTIKQTININYTNTLILITYDLDNKLKIWNIDKLQSLIMNNNISNAVTKTKYYNNVLISSFNIMNFDLNNLNKLVSFQSNEFNTTTIYVINDSIYINRFNSTFSVYKIK